MGDVRPEYVFLGFLVEGPAHGYHLYRLYKDSLEGLWHISESQMYASLKRLEKRGWIAPVREEPLGEETKSRQQFMLTFEGISAYERWLWTPTAASPRLLKLEFLTRLYFAMRWNLEEAYGLIEYQRLSLEKELNRLLDSVPPTGPASEHAPPLLFDISVLARDFRIRQIRTALDWMKELL
ncbi:MAG: PadR family transcriptional regulator [Treponema sp.]|nr:PadR family transcriptional regulator [Treponema sp.]